MIFNEEHKSQPISKLQVQTAFKKIKANKGSAGVDGVTIEMVSDKPRKYLYPLWNRMSSGSYFPKTVRQVLIPKGNGDFRPLGIPTVVDRVAQQVITTELENEVEPHFSPNSFGYRPNKSAHEAIEQCRINCMKYSWAIDLDIKGFFDNIDHELLLKAVEHYTDKKHILLYVKRWIEVAVELPDGTIKPSEGKGTPQGGVISPLLANLFLHYVLDKWLEKNYNGVEFVRYADDIVVHCKSEKQSHYVLEGIKRRLKACKLQLNEEKTKITYCQGYRRARRKDYPKKFDFLKYTFKPMTKKNRRSGRLFLGFDCILSMKSRTRIIKYWREMDFQRKSTLTLQDLAEMLNAKSRGLIEYYGKIEKYSMERIFQHLDFRIAKWVKNKFKNLRSYHRAYSWLRDIKLSFPNLFVHWSISKF
jgi:group II intron reverse transcriptase/maturase